MFETIKHIMDKKQDRKRKRDMLFNRWQMEELETGRQMGLDVSIYEKPLLKPYEMLAAREALMSGASPSVIRKIVDAYTGDDFDVDRYFELIEDSIYAIDLDFLRKKYHLFDIQFEKAKPFKKDVLYGTVFGDIAGSRYEFSLDTDARSGLHVEGCIGDGSTYTDDTVLACATAIVLKDPSLCIEQRAASCDDCSCGSTYPFVDNPFIIEYRRQTMSFPGVGYGS